MVVVSFIINLSLWLMWLTIWRTLGGYEFAPSLRASFVRSFRSSAFQFTRSQPPLALAVPLSRFTSQVGGGSAFFVRLLTRFAIMIDMILYALRQLATEVPLILVLIGCIITACILWRRAPAASVYIILACVFTLVLLFM